MQVIVREKALTEALDPNVLREIWPSVTRATDAFFAERNLEREARTVTNHGRLLLSRRDTHWRWKASLNEYAFYMILGVFPEAFYGGEGKLLDDILRRRPEYKV